MFSSYYRYKKTLKLPELCLLLTLIDPKDSSGTFISMIMKLAISKDGSSRDIKL